MPTGVPPIVLGTPEGDTWVFLSLLGSVPFRTGAFSRACQSDDSECCKVVNKDSEENKYTHHGDCRSRFVPVHDVGTLEVSISWCTAKWLCDFLPLNKGAAALKKSLVPNPPTSCLYTLMHLLEGQLASVAMSMAACAVSDWDLKSLAVRPLVASRLACGTEDWFHAVRRSSYIGIVTDYISGSVSRWKTPHPQRKVVG